MTTHHKINIPRITDKVLIHIRLIFKSQMREGNDKVAFLLILQIRSPTVRSLHIVQFRQTVRYRPLHNIGNIRQHPKNSNPETSTPDNHIRLHVLAELKRRKIIIGAYHRALQPGQAAGKTFNPVIELMITESNYIIAKGIHKVNLKFAAESRIVGCTLIEIPGMKKQEIPLSDSITYTVHKSSPLDDASPAGRLPGTLRLKMAVSIIEMHNGQPLCRGRKTGCKQRYRHRNNQSSHNQSIITTLPSLLYSMFFPAAVRDLMYGSITSMIICGWISRRSAFLAIE